MTRSPVNRIGGIETESGQDITVMSTPPSSCTSVTFPTDYDNTQLCYPSWWTPPGGTAREDWFNKYVVRRSPSRTPAAALIPATGHNYVRSLGLLSGGLALRRRHPDPLRPADLGRVARLPVRVTTETSTADGDPVTETKTHTSGHERRLSGSGNPVTAASLTAQRVGKVTAADSDQYAGTEFEHVVYNGASARTSPTPSRTPWSQPDRRPSRSRPRCPR